MSHVDYKIV